MIYRPQNQPGREQPPTPEEVAGQGESVDVLYDFYDFVDGTVEELQAHVLHRCSDPTLARDIVQKVYEVILKRWRVFRAKKQATLTMLIAIADRQMGSLPRTVPIREAPLPAALKALLKPMPEEEKRALRTALLAMYKRRRRVAMMMLLQTAVLLIAVPGASLFLVKPQPMGSTIRELAAVEILLGEQERSSIAVVAQVETHLRGLAAYHAEGEIADISIELASFALREQVAEKNTVNDILEQFNAGTIAAFIQTAFATSP